MARLPELLKVSKKFDLKIVSIEDLVAYRMQYDSLIEKKWDFKVETRFGPFRLRAYQQTTNQNTKFQQHSKTLIQKTFPNYI